jgi:hypothetical protein
MSAAGDGRQGAVFVEVQRSCFHCGGRGQSAPYASHQWALDLLVDAAEAIRFNADEARKLYRLAAKYEDSSADQSGTDLRIGRKSRDRWVALHRRNAIYLRALADAPDVAEVTRRRITMETRFVSAPTDPLRLSIVTAEVPS